MTESWGAPEGLLGGEQKRQENLEDCDFRRGFSIVWKARRPDSVAWGCKAYCVLPAPGQWALKGAAVLIDARAPGQFPLGCPKIHSTQVPAPARRAVRSSSSYLHHPSPPCTPCFFSFFSLPSVVLGFNLVHEFLSLQIIAVAQHSTFVHLTWALLHPSAHPSFRHSMPSTYRRDIHTRSSTTAPARHASSTTPHLR